MGSGAATLVNTYSREVDCRPAGDRSYPENISDVLFTSISDPAEDFSIGSPRSSVSYLVYPECRAGEYYDELEYSISEPEFPEA